MLALEVPFKDPFRHGVEVMSPGLFSLLGVLLSLVTRGSDPDMAVRFQKIGAWVSQHGGYVSPKLRYVDGTAKGAMLMTSESLKAGDKLLRIPKTLQISDDSRI